MRLKTPNLISAFCKAEGLRIGQRGEAAGAVAQAVIRSVELIVQPDADDVCSQVSGDGQDCICKAARAQCRGRLVGRAGRGRGTTKIEMEIFRFQAPLRRERIFNAPACGPTDITRRRDSESADRAGETLGATRHERGDPHVVERVVLLGKRNATGRVDEKIGESNANTRPHCSQPICVDRSATRQGNWGTWGGRGYQPDGSECKRIAQAERLNIGLNPYHPWSCLVVSTGLEAASKAIRSHALRGGHGHQERRTRRTGAIGREDAWIHGRSAPRIADVAADVEAGPAIDRCRCG